VNGTIKCNRWSIASPNFPLCRERYVRNLGAVVSEGPAQASLLMLEIARDSLVDTEEPQEQAVIDLRFRCQATRSNRRESSLRKHALISDMFFGIF
jgi:hypothetical protein